MALSLPKFKFESTYGNLQIQLKSLGITNLFTPGKGALCRVFDSLADCENIYISQVIQKTSIDVNEKGIMAAAVTANMLAGSSGEIPPNPTLLILDLWQWRKVNAAWGALIETRDPRNRAYESTLGCQTLRSGLLVD